MSCKRIVQQRHEVARIRQCIGFTIEQCLQLGSQQFAICFIIRLAENKRHDIAILSVCRASSAGVRSRPRRLHIRAALTQRCEQCLSTGFAGLPRLGAFLVILVISRRLLVGIREFDIAVGQLDVAQDYLEAIGDALICRAYVAPGPPGWQDNGARPSGGQSRTRCNDGGQHQVQPGVTVAAKRRRRSVSAAARSPAAIAGSVDGSSLHSV